VKSQSLRTSADKELVQQEAQRPDLGFGTKITGAQVRLLNQDGSFNVKRANESFWHRINLYNRLIVMSWTQFLGWVSVFYMISNLLFAGVYLLCGADSLASTNDVMFHGFFWKAFFFSAQTLTTVGYGHITPNTFLTSSIAAFESMVGLLSFALATGLLYGRFSRPKAHINFSKHSVIAPYLDTNGWMFRIINARSSQLIDLQVEVSLSRLETQPDGTRSRRYHRLKLERDMVAFFPTNWTLVHAITDDSPLYGSTSETLADSESEFLILFRALDDAFSQMVHVRFSYRAGEIRWGQKFSPMVETAGSGQVTVDLNRLDDTEFAPLN
jgi:inward rectifier potassium channel